MTPTEIFPLTNLIAMSMWALMMFLPYWKITHFLMDFKVIPFLLSLTYLVYISISINQGIGLNYGSLKGVMHLFTHEHVVLAGWVHYLAFDLLIGIYLLEQNRSIKLPHLLMIPVLFSTFMFGPVGFLLFTIIKNVKRKLS